MAGACGGHPTNSISPSEEPAGSRRRVRGVFPAARTGEPEESTQAPEPTCLRGAWGTAGREARGMRETGPQGADRDPTARRGDGCRPGFQRYVSLQAGRAQRLPLCEEGKARVCSEATGRAAAPPAPSSGRPCRPGAPQGRGPRALVLVLSKKITLPRRGPGMGPRATVLAVSFSAPCRAAGCQPGRGVRAGHWVSRQNRTGCPSGSLHAGWSPRPSQ